MMLSGRPPIDTYSASAVTKLQSQEQSQVSISRTIKYLRYKETSDQKTNFLAEKVIEPRSSHLLQRYLSFDILNHSLGTTTYCKYNCSMISCSNGNSNFAITLITNYIKSNQKQSNFLHSLPNATSGWIQLQRPSVGMNFDKVSFISTRVLIAAS